MGTFRTVLGIFSLLYIGGLIQANTWINQMLKNWVTWSNLAGFVLGIVCTLAVIGWLGFVADAKKARSQKQDPRETAAHQPEEPNPLSPT